MDERIAYVLSIAPNRDFPKAVILTVDCPWCSGRHVHGAPDGVRPNGRYGRRVAHCPGGLGRSYDVVDDRAGR